MMEKGAPVRRSRRAASLTAQVLWSMQLEDDNSTPSNKVTNKSGRNPSVSKNSLPASSTSGAKRGRKRSTADWRLPQKSLGEDPVSGESFQKKRKLSTGSSGQFFPVTKPLQVRRDPKMKEKLTASVAPLIKPRPTPPRSAPDVAANSSATNMSQVNPILLLPVSLRANQGAGQVNTDMGSLSLVTLQAPSDLLNCFGLNKTIVNTNTEARQWTSARQSTASSHSISVGVNVKSSGSASDLLPTLSSQSLNPYSSYQVEPLNLKMGETTIPSSSSPAYAKPNQAAANPTKTPTFNLPRDHLKIRLKIPATQAKGARNSRFLGDNSVSSKQTTAVKPQRKKDCSGPVNIIPFKQQPAATKGRKKQSKCPSPDYSCSSPDVDDVQREPRHSCNRRQINLRKKAAPPPGSREYEEIVEEQRQILAQLKRAQRAKERTKARLEAARTAKSKRKETEENRSLIAPSEPFKLSTPEESNNGWIWSGKPYSCLVFSVECGKYVRRCCYPGMTRKDAEHGTTDIVLVRDCVFLRAGGDDELPYIAKVSALWEKPDSKEMMMSLVWYYRPEHTDDTKLFKKVSEDELFSSRHQDEISVACVEERCKVTTYLQFCRLHAKLRRDGMWADRDIRNIVPRAPVSFKRPSLSGETPLDPGDMFFSRHFYEVHQKRVRSKLPLPTSLCPDHGRRSGAVSLI